MRIDGAFQNLNSLSQAPKATPTPDQKGEDFGQMLMDAIKDVNQTQQQAGQLKNDFMAGRPVEYHDLMISMEKASTAMQLTLQVRNKVLEAYQEINKITV